ncbi:MAG: rhodanese-related sulfurtransferase [Acidimicrobiia bacterium]|nr:rhodanese-related sulfurtransferase [Acidimicrobiia bacterium]
MKNEKILVAAFYRFAPFDDYASWQPSLKSLCEAGGVRGSILLAPEGVNGTIAGSPEAVRTVVGLLHSDKRFADMTVKESWCDATPFVRMKVRLKSEIVPLGVGVDLAATGIRVRPEDWNDLIASPGIVAIDTRNDYEIEIGTFPGSINPGVASFRDFTSWVDGNADLDRDTPIAMFCTGGIRCEKASAYMREQGFSEVYQLDGGILNYLASVSEDESTWQGSCYVFDRRVAVDASLRSADHEICVSCNRVLKTGDRALPGYQEGVTCDACHRTTSPQRKRRFQERQRQLRQARLS